MILTFIFIGMIILGWIIFLIDEHTYVRISDELNFFAGIGLVGGGIALFISIAIIIGAHIGADNYIAQNDIEYNSLCQRLEIVQSDYEDVSKSDVIKDIAEWNKDVIHEQYWTYNPWTNWFHNKEVTDNLKTIDY